MKMLWLFETFQVQFYELGCGYNLVAFRIILQFGRIQGKNARANGSTLQFFEIYLQLINITRNFHDRSVILLITSRKNSKFMEFDIRMKSHSRSYNM